MNPSPKPTPSPLSIPGEPANGLLFRRQARIKAGSIQLQVDLASPIAPVGWVIFVQLEPGQPTQASQAAHSFNQVGLATMIVHLRASATSLNLATDQLRAATAWLQAQPEGQGLPFSYFGIGLGTAVALRAAAAEPHLTTVISWNGRPELAWWQLSAVAAPALLLVGEQASAFRRWSNRLAGWRLGSGSDFMIVPDSLPAVETFIHTWFNQHLSRTNARSGLYRKDHPQLAVLKQRLAAGTLLLALSLPLAAPPGLALAAQRPSTFANSPAPDLPTAEKLNPVSTTILPAFPTIVKQASLEPLEAGEKIDHNAHSSRRSGFDFSDGLALTMTDIDGDGFSPRLNRSSVVTTTTPLRQDQDLAKDEQKWADGSYSLGPNEVAGDGLNKFAVGSAQLIDSGGLEWFINTDITFTTSSSVSGAASEASFTAPVAATTSGGGTTLTTLSDAFDGYNGLCVSFSGATGPCTTDSPNYTIYNENGPATFDPTCNNREVIFSPQPMNEVLVSRKVFVPSNDAFARWLNVFTNTGVTTETVTMVTSNNLGSDTNTILVSSSDGDTTAELTDNWVSTFQDYLEVISPDPRLGHVLQEPGAPVGLAAISFADGLNNPRWAYTFDLPPGETAIIMNFATGQPSKAAANAKAAELVDLPPNAVQCMTPAELSQVVNFDIPADLAVTQSVSPDPVLVGQPLTYTLTITNNGPNEASNVVVTNNLPPNVTFTSASGASWSCNEAAGVVSCTLPSLALGGAPPITIQATAPLTITTLTNTVSVTGTTTDRTLSSNSQEITSTVVSPASVAGTKTVAGQFQPGQTITYEVVLTNTGPSIQFDNPGDEFTDVLPADLALVSASASSGVANANLAGNTVGWNGSLTPNTPVTLTIQATINNVPSGTVISNQGLISFDNDGNGVNEASGATDDPASAGSTNPTSFTVTVSDGPAIIYLPVIIKDGLPGLPDLVVDGLVTSRTAITVVIKNQGDGPVVDAFWVDAYIDPMAPPTLNQQWDVLGDQGVAWGVTGAGLNQLTPGGVLTLTLSSPYHFAEYSNFEAPLAAGTPVWAQVDAINYATTFGAVPESDESNNVAGPQLSVAGGLEQAVSTGDQEQPPAEGELPARE